MTAGVPTDRHPRVGKRYIVTGSKQPDGSRKVGVCVSVTPWGNNRIRWMRLRFEDGTEKSYAPSHLWRAA